MIKRVVLTTFLVFLFLVLAVPVLASEEASGTGDPLRGLFGRGAKNATSSPKRGDVQSDRIAKAKERAYEEIGRRIEAMKRLSATINKMKRLSSEQKSTFVGQIQEEITNLTNLKAKIEAETDVNTLKKDKQSIVTSYRVYALFIPKIHLLAAADAMLEAVEKMTEMANKLETHIDEAKAKGKDVASLEELLSDMRAKTADAKAQAEKVLATVTPLTPSGFPGNKSVLLEAHKMLKKGREDLRMAREDAHKIVKGLRAFKNRRESSSSPSASNVETEG